MCRSIAQNGTHDLMYIVSSFWDMKVTLNSQQSISRILSMSKIENSCAYKRMEEDETEEKRMNGDNSQ